MDVFAHVRIYLFFVGGRHPVALALALCAAHDLVPADSASLPPSPLIARGRPCGICFAMPKRFVCMDATEKRLARQWLEEDDMKPCEAPR